VKCGVVTTIVVPTRNRQACLSALLDTLERYHLDQGQQFQVVIADNSDDDSLRARVARSPLSIDYLYSSERLSVVDNFSRTLECIRGDYVCFIGDDDIVSSRLFEVVALMKREALDAAILATSLRCLYFWPGVVHKRWGDVGGRLYLSNVTGVVRPLDVGDALQESRLRICDGPLGLPRAYFGVVSKRSIDAAIERFGTLFGGVSPDIFSSRILAVTATRCISVDLPFIAPGASKSSTSAARAERVDVGKLGDNDHTGRIASLDWNPLIPEFYAPFTVWAQSLLQAEALTGTQPRAWAFAYLYAKCLLFSRGHFSSVAQAIGRHRMPRVALAKTVLCVAYVSIEYLWQKLPLLLRRRPGGADHCFEAVPTSDAASRLLDTRLAAVPLQYDAGR
jgi:Glycosyl transferase family 2